jgi:hypothetical protein
VIKISKVQTFGWEAAVRGMRNPYDSWDKSDSYGEKIGPADRKLMMSLVRGGTDHSKFLRFITVTFDITAPMYFLKEWDTYKVGTVSNGTSTMHKIASKPFTEGDFSTEHLSHANMITFNYYTEALNRAREKYLETGSKDDWWQMIQMLPSSYNQTRTMSVNYQVLRNMYHARKNHKQDEWKKEFTKWIHTLPNAWLITEV